MRFGIDFEWIFGASDLEKSIKTIGFSMVLRIFTKSTFSKKVRKNLDFWSRIRRPKRRKIKKKCVEKRMFF